MIKLAVFLTLVAVAYSRSSVGYFGRQIARQCISEMNIEGEDLASLREQFTNEIFGIVLTSTNSVYNCFYKCVNEKMHLADSNAVITPRDYILFLLSKIGPEMLTEEEMQEQIAIINTCANANVEDLCERSVKIAKCVEREWINKP